MRFEQVNERNKSRLRLHKKKCLLAQTNRVTYQLQIEKRSGLKSETVDGGTFRSEEGPLQAVANIHFNHESQKTLMFRKQKKGVRACNET